MRILILEDEPDLAQPLVELLERERYEVAWASRLETGYQQLLAGGEFDLAVLDVMLPDGEDAGFEFASYLRSANFPGRILFLTARDAIEDRVRGLDLGGDDYLVKPFSLREFLARVRALLRRDAQTRQSVLQRGPLLVELTARRISWAGNEVNVTDREFGLVELFALYPDRVFSATELRHRFFPLAESGDQVVRVYVWQLRNKIAKDLVLTVPGGYRLGVA